VQAVDRTAHSVPPPAFDKTPQMASLRFAGWCGLVACVTTNAGWIAGDLAQPAAFSPAHDDISDLGALTASSPWLYNRASNLSGLAVVLLGVGLWRALRSSALGRVAASTLVGAGIGLFLDGIFRLDCQGIDVHCANDSWHSHAHKIESGFTASATLLALLLIALAFRRIPEWRKYWRAMLAAVPALFLANVLFSLLGDGAATRAGSVVISAWFAFVGFRLLRTTNADAPLSTPVSRARTG
jgi:hypothetical protein